MAESAIPELMAIVTRAEAKERGLPRYFTGKPCKHGHVGERYSGGNGDCVECATKRAEVWRLKNPELKRENAIRWNSENADVLRERNAKRYAENRASVMEKSRLWYHQNRDRAKEAKAAWYAANRDRERARTRLNESKNPEAARLRRKRWRAKNLDRLLEKSALWYRENLDRAKAASAKRYAKNTDHIREINRIWYLKNKARFRQTSMIWKQNNIEKVRASHSVRRARLRGAEGHYVAADIHNMLRSQKGRCAHPWCRVSIKAKYHIDHIIALANGGTNWPRNLQLLCPTCNCSKGAKHPLDVARRYGMLV